MALNTEVGRPTTEADSEEVIEYPVGAIACQVKGKRWMGIKDKKAKSPRSELSFVLMRWNNLPHHPLVAALSQIQCPASHPRRLEEDNKTDPILLLLYLFSPLYGNVPQVQPA